MYTKRRLVQTAVIDRIARKINNPGINVHSLRHQLPRRSYMSCFRKKLILQSLSWRLNGLEKSGFWLAWCGRFLIRVKIHGQGFHMPLCFCGWTLEGWCFEETLGVNIHSFSNFPFFEFLVNVCFLCTWVTPISIFFFTIGKKYLKHSLQLGIINLIVEILFAYFVSCTILSPEWMHDF